METTIIECASVGRTVPAGPMGLDDILPMIRMVADLRERGRQREADAEAGECGGVDEYAAAAELEERIRQPITVAGRVLEPDEGPAWQWWAGAHSETQNSVMASTCGGTWSIVLTAYSDHGPVMSQVGSGPTIAAALSDARERYLCAIDATLLRMGGLLREVAAVPTVRCPRCLGCKVTITGFDDVAHQCHVCGGAGEVARRECEICGRKALETGSELRCAEHDSEAA